MMKEIASLAMLMMLGVAHATVTTLFPNGDFDSLRRHGESLG